MTANQTAFEHIDQHIQLHMDYHRIPGAAFIVIDQDETLHTSTFGVANIHSGQPVTTEHLFATGSIGKSFTAIALLQLVEEGCIDLHAPVRDYLPWFEVGGEFGPITAHHLLTHTAGIIGVNDVLTDKLYDVWALRKLDAGWEPGSKYHYSNVGYKTLGLVLERLENSSYGEIIRRRILDPLGMVETEPETVLDMRHKLVTGYLPAYDDRPWLPHHGVTPAAWLEIATGEGCMAAPIEEQALYLRALMNRDRRLLSASSYDLFMAKHVEVEPNHWYGYGIDRDEMDGHTLISHGGEMPGHMAYMMADLDTGIGFVIMINSVVPLWSFVLPIHHMLAAAASNQALPEIALPTDRRIINGATEMAGTYCAISDDAPGFDLVADNHRLTLRSEGEQVSVWQVGEGIFVADHPRFNRLPLRFGDGENSYDVVRHGQVRYVRESENAPTTFSTPDVDRADIAGLIGHYRTYGSVFTNFRIMPGWGDELLFVMPSGEEQHLHHIEGNLWRIDDTPERVRFETFVEGQALRAIFSGCDYYRTFTE